MDALLRCAGLRVRKGRWSADEVSRRIHHRRLGLRLEGSGRAHLQPRRGRCHRPPGRAAGDCSLAAGAAARTRQALGRATALDQSGGSRLTSAAESTRHVGIRGEQGAPQSAAWAG
jgi:hypothetical protein